MNHIVIIGFMGSGKTRVGKRLAKDFDLPFIDIDRVVTRKMNLSVKDIFDNWGTILSCIRNNCDQGADQGSGTESDFSGIRTSHAGAE